jgi:hypothetical protein
MEWLKARHKTGEEEVRGLAWQGKGRSAENVEEGQQRRWANKAALRNNVLHDYQRG